MAAATATVAGFALPGFCADESEAVSRRLRIGVSSYSFWRFRNNDFRPLTTCLDHAAEIGFDGLEILQRQLTDTSPAALNEIKRHAFSLGLDLMGYSTHQGFVSPDAEKRKKNVAHTTDCLEQAYQLGIPTIRVNTGTWEPRNLSTT